jgi:hypothetical protein
MSKDCGQFAEAICLTREQSLMEQSCWKYAFETSGLTMIFSLLEIFRLISGLLVIFLAL